MDVATGNVLDAIRLCFCLHVDQPPFQMFKAKFVHPVIDRHFAQPISLGGLCCGLPFAVS